MKKRGRKQKVKKKINRKKNPYFKLELLIIVITILFSLFGFILIENNGAIGNVITGFSEFSIYPEQDFGTAPIEEETTNETFTTPIEPEQPAATQEPISVLPIYEEPAPTEEESAEFGIQPIENLSVQIGMEEGFGIMPIENLTANITEIEPAVEITPTGFEKIKYCVDTSTGRKTISPMEIRGKCITQTEIDLLFPCLLQSDLTIICELNEDLVNEIEAQGYDLSGFSSNEFGISAGQELNGFKIIEIRDKVDRSSKLDEFQVQQIGNLGPGYWTSPAGVKLAEMAVTGSGSGVSYETPFGIGTLRFIKGKQLVLQLDLEKNGGVVLNPGHTNVWEITDFFYGQCYNCSIDTNVTLTNLHTTQNESSMVGYWKFTDNAKDSSSQGNDGTVSGARHIHEKYDFDGSGDYITITNTTHYVPKNITISAWVKPNFNRVPAAGKYHHIYDRRTNQGGWQLISVSIYCYAGGSSCRLINEIYKNGTSTGFHANNINWTIGEWHHVAVSYGEHNCASYWDGSVVDTSSGCQLPNITATAYISRSSSAWNGTMDEIVIYNKSLSATDISDLYNDGLYHTVDYGDAYIDGGVLDLTEYNRIREIYFTCSSDSYSNCSLSYRSGNYTGIDLTDTGLVSYWNLSDAESSEVFQDSMAVNNSGTCSGNTCPNRTAGIFENDAGMEFDGVNDFIDINSTTAVRFNDTLTISAWVYPKTTAGNYQIIFLGEKVGYNMYYIDLASSGRLLVYYGDGTTLASNTGGVTSVNNWYHVVGTLNSTDLCLYVNSALQGGNCKSVTGFFNATEIHGSIGRYTFGNSQFFNGTIDSVAIYNRSLSASEIEALYHTTGTWTTKDYASPVHIAHDNKTLQYRIYLESSNMTSTPTLTNVTLFYNNSAPTITSLAGSHYPVDNSNMVGYWRFDDDASDSTANGNDGTVTGAKHSFEGRVGKAYEFDGKDDYIDLPALDIKGDKTVSAWVYPKESGDVQVIFGDYGLWAFYIDGTDKLTIYAQASSLTGSALSIDTWHHVVATVNGTDNNHSIYINGALDKTGIITGASNISSSDFAIGAQTTSDPWNGTIDEGIIWNTSLSTEQIQDIYNSTRGAHGVDKDTGIKTNYDLGCGMNTSDEDQDNRSQYEIRWYNTTVLEDSLANYSDIKSSNTTKNDSWHCEARTYDGFEWSNWDNSSNLFINNTKPGIIPTIGSHYPVNNSYMVGYWRFDNGSLDSSPQSNHGTPTGATHTHEGRVGNAYEFNGSGDGITIDNTGGKVYNNNERNNTVCYWFNQKGASKTQPMRYIFSYVGGIPGNRFYTLDSLNDFDLDVQVGDTTTNNIASYTANTWHHVCVEVTNNTYMVYFDGTNRTADISYVHSNIFAALYISEPTVYAVNGTIDEVIIYNTSLSTAQIQDIYNSTRGAYHVYKNFDLGCGMTTSDEDLDNRTQYEITWYNNSIEETKLANYSDIKSGNTSSGEAWICEARTHDSQDWSDKDNSSLNIDNKPPTAGAITWVTTGGFTDNTLAYNQYMKEINISVIDPDDNSDINQTRITVYDPNGNKIINNVTMTNLSLPIYNYSSTFQFTKSGIYTINITSDDLINITSNSTWFNVSTNILSLADGWYGYTNESILSDQDIADYTNYEFDIYEFSTNSSNLVSKWGSIKSAINSSYLQNIKSGINILLNIDYSSAAEIEQVKININNTLNDTLQDPYSISIEYISFELFDQASYTDAQKYGALNDIAETATDRMDNKFAVYSKNYDHASLDQAYISGTLLLYPDPTTSPDFMNQEANLMRTNDSINRIYTNINTTLMTHAYTYQKDIIDQIRGTINETTVIANDKVAEIITNGTRDIVVFNNQSSPRLIPVNVSEINYVVLRKDAWDITNKLLTEKDSDLNFSVNTSAYTATMIIFEDLDHIQLDSNASEVLFKGAASSTKSFNYTNATENFNGSWSVSGNNDIRIELFDPHYIRNNFITYYGWLNTTYTRHPEEWENYEIVILADHNQAELAKLNYTQTEFYGYIGVADYNAAMQNNWYSNKTNETDAWLDLNASLNIFIDGLDTGIGGANFSSRMKDLTDYVQITKDRKAILNTYTAYEDFATWGTGGVMKESCVNRWNGVSGAAVANYSRENWDLELNKSKWYKKHNVKVLCQAFNNLSGAPLYYPYNYTDLENIYFASKVLGYDYFFLSDPLFNSVPTEYIYDVGTDLAKDCSTNDNKTYYRRYSNGIVYYNTTSEKGWIESGRKINEVKVCFEVYDNALADGDVFSFVINKDGNSTQTGDYNISDADCAAWTWEWHCVTINETDYDNAHGRYIIEAWTMPRAGGAGGLSLAYADTLLTGEQGRHSWYDLAAVDSWTAYGTGRNWHINLTINETIKTSVDAFTTIIQNMTGTHQYRNITLSSGNNYNISVWSVAYTDYDMDLRIFEIWNSTNFVNLNYTNVSDCTSNDPSWSTTTTGGITYHACIYDDNTNVTYRFAGPITSKLIARGGANNPPAISTIIGAHIPVNNTHMVGYWRFDNGSLDSSPQSNHGTPSGAKHSFEGRVGKGYEFNGTGDYINMSSTTGITHNYTISSWVYKEADTGDTTFLIYDERDSGNDGITLGLYDAGATDLRSYCKRNADADFGSGIILNDNQWYHLACVYNSTDIEHYVDGSLIYIDASAGATAIATTPTIGARSFTAIDNEYNGTIDEVIIWNTSLSTAQIQDIYNSTRGQYGRGRYGGVKTDYDLGCGLNTSDPDLDNRTQYEIKWYNTTLLESRLTNYSDIKSSNTTKNEYWHCEARVYDGQDWSTRENTSILLINNTVPDITSIYIITDDMLLNHTNTNLTGTFNVSDIDLDSMTQNQTTWYNNSVEESKLRNHTYVTSGNTTGNDQWIFSARTNDGQNWSEWENSSALTIINYYPRIFLVSPINDSTQTSTDPTTFVYNVTDHDPLLNCSLIIDSKKIKYNSSIVYRNGSNREIEYYLASNTDYEWSVNCTDSLNLENHSQTWELTIARQFPSPPSGWQSGPGAGGVGGAQSHITDIQQTETGVIYTIPTLLTPIEIKTLDPSLHITSIIITPAREISNVKVSVEELQNIPIEKPKSDVIKFIKVTSENLPNSLIYQAIFKFKVLKSEIINEIIELQHYDNAQWRKLPTKLTKQDDTFNYYEATSTSLSYFAITTSRPTYTEKVAFTIFPELKEKLKELTRLTKQDILLYAVLPLAIIALLLVFIIRFIYKKLSKHKKLRRFIFIITPLIILGLFIPLEKDILLYAILPLSIITLILYLIIHFIIKHFKKPIKTKKKIRKK